MCLFFKEKSKILLCFTYHEIFSFFRIFFFVIQVKSDVRVTWSWTFLNLIFPMPVSLGNEKFFCEWAAYENFSRSPMILASEKCLKKFGFRLLRDFNLNYYVISLMFCGLFIWLKSFRFYFYSWSVRFITKNFNEIKFTTEFTSCFFIYNSQLSSWCSGKIKSVSLIDNITFIPVAGFNVFL